ncbi:MAG: LysE family translocator [Marinibacterium sp.]|nr:LysE family translocator [Marinibacterium sp.]
MVDGPVLLAFVPAALALNLTPGADMMFCVGQGLRSGGRAALAASAGVACGVLMHAALAGLGLGTMVAALPWAFDVIRWIGVGYLLWLALQSLRSGPVGAASGDGLAHPFRSGFVVNITNPKVILFVLAFVPQFVDPTRAVLPQFLLLGLVLSLGGFVANALAGVLAGRAGQQVMTRPRAARLLGWLSGGIFAALALRLAILERG